MSDTMHFILEIAMFVLACGMILAFIRAVRGPRFTDRIVAINMIGTMTTVMIWAKPLWWTFLWFIPC